MVFLLKSCICVAIAQTCWLEMSWQSAAYFGGHDEGELSVWCKLGVSVSLKSTFGNAVMVSQSRRSWGKKLLEG
jgi:hypothetical protein